MRHMAPLIRMAASEGLTFYRLRCGPKVWSAWLPNRDDCFRAGLLLGLTYQDSQGMITLGPLVWIETGTRRYARSRTIPQPRLR